jgi:hypothetical protein
MTKSRPQGHILISHVHNAALCREIGERLRISMGQTPVGMPPRLTALMKQLRDESSKPIRMPGAFR